MSEDVRLTPKQQTAAQLIAWGHMTFGQIAVEVGVADKTIRRWREIEEFDLAVKAERAEVTTRGRSRLLSSMHAAIGLFESVVSGDHLDPQEESPTVRDQLYAASRLGSFAVRLLTSSEAAEATIAASRPESVEISLELDSGPDTESPDGDGETKEAVEP